MISLALGTRGEQEKVETKWKDRIHSLHLDWEQHGTSSDWLWCVSIGEGCKRRSLLNHKRVNGIIAGSKSKTINGERKTILEEQCKLQRYDPIRSRATLIKNVLSTGMSKGQSTMFALSVLWNSISMKKKELKTIENTYQICSNSGNYWNYRNRNLNLSETVPTSVPVGYSNFHERCFADTWSVQTIYCK